MSESDTNCGYRPRHLVIQLVTPADEQIQYKISQSERIGKFALVAAVILICLKLIQWSRR